MCLNVSACTKQTHAASQSTVPLTAYEDGIYKFYKKKKKNERKKQTALLNYVEEINNLPAQNTHTDIHANLLDDDPIFSSFHFFFPHLSSDITQIDRRG